MQFIDDDMDELARRAAENYPLKTDGAAWDKMLQKLQQETPVIEKKNNNGRFLWLLLLLPMFFICNRYSGDVLKNKSTGNADQTKAANEIDRTLQYENNIITNTPIADQEKSIEQTSAEPDQSVKQQKKDKADGLKLLTSDYYYIAKKLSSTKWRQRERVSDQMYNEYDKEEKKPGSPVDYSSDASVAMNNETSVADNIETDTPEPTNSQIKINDPETNNTEKKEKLTTQKSVDSLQQEKPGIENKAEQKKARGKLYYGFVAGPDFSTVKFQKIEGVGYNFGVVAGYQITKRLSVETGFTWNNKKYHSKGKYFDAKYMNWPAHTELVYIGGYCNMYEIPLNIRYDWLQKVDQRLFATAGISSYLMNKESYDYTVQRYGMPYKGSKSYYNATKDWFSVLNIGLGYQTKLGKIGDLRIEPYFKLPASGLGIGSMSITSTGVNFGLIRSIQ